MKDLLVPTKRKVVLFLILIIGAFILAFVLSEIIFAVLCMPCCTWEIGWPVAMMEQFYQNGTKCADDLGDIPVWRFDLIALLLDVLFWYLVVVVFDFFWGLSEK